jgi:hypothetical protein
VVEPAFGELQGVALEFGPQTPKVMVPVGAPRLALPIRVAVSVTVFPRGMLELLSADLKVGLTALAALAQLTPAVPAVARVTVDNTAMTWTKDRCIRRPYAHYSFVPTVETVLRTLSGRTKPGRA